MKDKESARNIFPLNCILQHMLRNGMEENILRVSGLSLENNSERNKNQNF